MVTLMTVTHLFECHSQRKSGDACSHDCHGDVLIGRQSSCKQGNYRLSVLYLLHHPMLLAS